MKVIKVCSQMMTVKQAAKWLVWDMGDNVEFWYESSNIDSIEISSSLEKKLSKEINKQSKRVRNFLNIDSFWN